MKTNGFASKIVAVMFLLLLFGFSITNIWLLKEPISALKDKEITFREFAGQVASVYRSGLKQREDFISLNGGYARLSGMRVSNGIILMKNGMLTDEMATVDPSYTASQVTALYQYLQEQGTEFLFVQSPHKPDLNNTLLPIGTENKSNEIADAMLTLLDGAGVPYMDLRPHLIADEEMLEKYFYKTDHHWNAEGAFVAFELLSGYLQKTFPEQEILSTATDRDSWERHVREDYFLGSHGRRVGIGFAGLDDLIYLTPKFHTEISCAVPDRLIFRKGTFEEAVLDRRYLTEDPDYYNTNPYCIHTGGDYPHVQFRNAEASSDLNVLLIKDSFGLPLEGFLSTVFRQVDTLDFRYVKGNYGIKEMVESIAPDVVIVMINPSVLGDTSAANFKLSTAVREKGEAVIDAEEYEISAMETPFRNIELATLECGQPYILEMDSVELSGENAACLVASVYDPVAKKRLKYYCIDVSYIEETDGKIRWVFTTPETSQGELKLLIYPGVPGQASGVGALLHGVSLFKGAENES